MTEEKKALDEMLLRMEKEALHEMLHYHEKSGKQKAKELVKKAAGRYVPPEDLIFWPTAMIANSLTEWKNSAAGKGMSAVKNYFDRWIKGGMPVYCVDDVLAGVSLIDLYKETGEEKYKAGADKMAGYLFGLEKEAADGAGSIPYRPGQKNQHVYADGVGMTASFLVKYGTVFNDAHGVELGLGQMRNMFLYGMDEKTGLPYHGFQFESRIKYGIIGWGRAAGWLLMALARMRRCLGECDELYWQLFHAVRPYQKENGAFTWQLGAAEGPEDSSATAMIAYAAAMGLQKDIDVSGLGIHSEKGKADRHEKEASRQKEAGKLVKQASEYLAGCEKDGKIYHCLAECMGFSQYPQEYGAYPWSLGQGLGVLKAELRKKMEE